MARAWVVVSVAVLSFALFGCPPSAPPPQEKGGKVEIRVPTTEVPKVEAPKVEAPKVEAPKVEAPKVEAPKVEAPKVEAPKVEAPKVEAPKVEAPKVEAPKVEAPKTEAPKVEAPKPPPPPEGPKVELKELMPGCFAVDLTGVFNSTGSTAEADRSASDLDKYKQSFPAECLPNPGKMEVKDSPAAFEFPTKEGGKKNNVSCSGQTIALSGNAKALHFLATAVDANQEAKLHIEYADGGTDVDLKVTDWCGNPAFGEKEGVVSPNRIAAKQDGSGMEKETKTCRIWAITVPVDPKRTLKEIKLPEKPEIHIFAISVGR